MKCLFLISCLFLLTGCFQELEPIDPLNTGGFAFSSTENISSPFSNCFGLFAIKNANLINLPSDESSDAIWEAFENWQEKSSGLFFREIKPNEIPDIEINFGNNLEIFKGQSNGNGLLKFPTGFILCDIQFVKEKPILWLNSSYNWSKPQITAAVGFLIGRAYGLNISTDNLSLLQNNLNVITQINKPSLGDIDFLQRIIAQKCISRANFSLQITPRKDYFEYVSILEFLNWGRDVKMTHGILLSSKTKFPTFDNNEKNIIISETDLSGNFPNRFLNINYTETLNPNTTYTARPYYFDNQGLICYGKRITFKL